MANETDASLYLDLLKRCLLGLIQEDPSDMVLTAEGAREGRTAFALEARLNGTDWPSTAQTMIGIHRLENIQHCIERVVADGVAGDVIETGVWRGGAVIFMRAVLKALGVTDRRVWVADSFRGLPKPDAAKSPHDAGYDLSGHRELAVSLADVQQNFRRYGLLDEQVRFVEGWFHESLPGAPIERLAVLRLDGDLYSSTMDVLTVLYDRLSVGGYVIVDDYAIPPCRQAVEDFRAARRIADPIERIDWTGVFWRRT